MKLSIVVGTFNRKEQIRGCVESIIAQTHTSHCIYITDAGSTDGTIEYLKSIESGTIRPILVGKRIGQARAYNDVFKQLNTPYVCWLSDDNVIVNHGLDVAVDILAQEDKIGMVGLKVKDVQGPFVDAPYIGGISEIGILNVNQGVLRTDLLQRVGGFSETFRDYGIDPDLSAKVLFSGYDLVYTRAVAIHHFRNWSVDRSSPEYAALAAKQQRSLDLYRQKYDQWRSHRAPLANAKRGILSWVKRKSDNAQLINSTTPFLGSLPRDWFNILNGRFISLLDPFICAGKKFHLRQRCPQPLLPQALPPDPG